MDEAINQTWTLCPQYPNATLAIPKLYDTTIFSDSQQLAKIACDAEQLADLGQHLKTAYVSRILIVFGPVGIISSVLSLFSYRLKEFSENVFHYYRAINFFDLIYMIYTILAGVNFLNSSPVASRGETIHREPHFISDLPTEVYKYLVRFVGQSAHLLVAWLAFDRAAACSGVVWHKKMESRLFVIKVIIGISTFSLLYDVPFTYFDLRFRYFNGTNPETPLAIVSRVFTAVEGTFMLVCMCWVIVGLVRMSRKKRRLMGQQHIRRKSHDEENAHVIPEIKKNQSLCILQMCEGVPFLLSMLAIYASYSTNFLMIYRENAETIVLGGTYEENSRHQFIYWLQTYIRYFAITPLDVFSHGFHFYIYLAFSPKFRRTVMAYVRRKRGQRKVAPEGHSVK